MGSLSRRRANAKREWSGQNGETTPLGSGLVETLLQLLVAEKSGFSLNEQLEHPELAKLNDAADRMSRQAMESVIATRERTGQP